MSDVDIEFESEKGLAGELRQAAAELFFDKGYEATTIREIATVLDVKSATLYYYFESKEHILYRVIRSTMDEVLAGLRMMLDREERVEDRLAGLLVNHVVMHALRPKETTLGETELRSLTDERRDDIVRMRDEYIALLVGVLEDGVRDGVFEVADPKVASFAIVALCTDVGIWFRPGGRLALEEMTHLYVNLVLRMVGAPLIDKVAVARLAGDARDFHEGLGEFA
jgi:AcrR family transcriptional regulator